MTMDTFLCECCKLAFEVGGHMYWELDGRCEQFVCRKCGTMHRLEEAAQGSQLLSLTGPASIEIVKPKSGPQEMAFWEHIWSFAQTDWQQHEFFPCNIENLQQINCINCHQSIPIKDEVLPENERCPRCTHPMTFLYHTTVN